MAPGSRYDLSVGLRRTAAIAAVAFGVVTIAAGARVLTGSDPGYVVFRPLLVFNTLMGAVYAIAGAAIWQSASKGKWASGAIFALNGLVLVVLVLLYGAGRAIAPESLGAMTFRTAAWLGLFLVVRRADRQPASASQRWEKRTS